MIKLAILSSRLGLVLMDGFLKWTGGGSIRVYVVLKVLYEQKDACSVKGVERCGRGGRLRVNLCRRSGCN